MTADRRRKQAIRARMAETGEAYSVAARAIDAARQAAREAAPAAAPAGGDDYSEEAGDGLE